MAYNPVDLGWNRWCKKRQTLTVSHGNLVSTHCRRGAAYGADWLCFETWHSQCCTRFGGQGFSWGPIAYHPVSNNPSQGQTQQAFLEPWVALNFQPCGGAHWTGRRQEHWHCVGAFDSTLPGGSILKVQRASCNIYVKQYPAAAPGSQWLNAWKGFMPRTFMERSRLDLADGWLPKGRYSWCYHRPPFQPTSVRCPKSWWLGLCSSLGHSWR